MDLITTLAVIFFGSTLFLVCICMAIVKGEPRRRRRKEDKANGIKRFFALEHVEGLGVVEKSPCSVVLSLSTLTITCTGKEYTLPLKRITYVDFIVDSDKIRYLQSSVAKGVVGAALFGTSGAVIGTTPKAKVAYEAIGYAVIAYRDMRGEEKIIILRDQSANSYICSTLVRTLEARIHVTVEKVEL